MALRHDELWEETSGGSMHDQINVAPAWTQRYDEWRLSQGMGAGRSPRLRVAGGTGGQLVVGGLTTRRVVGARQVLSRSQTMSTPSSSASTTLAGCCLSMWPTRPL